MLYKNLQYFLPLFVSNFLYIPESNNCLCSGLQKYLNHLGFHIVGYGCTTCIGNSGDIDDAVAAAITENGKFLDRSSAFWMLLLRILLEDHVS